MNIKKITTNITKVLRQKNYLIIFLITFVLGLALLLKLSRLDTLFTMNSTQFILISLAATVLTAGLFAINIPLMVNKFKIIRKLTGGKSITGTFLGLFGGMAGSGCPVCGSAILSLFGITGGLAIFPLKGLELKTLGILMLGFSAYTLSKDNDKLCVPKKEIETNAFSEGKYGTIMMIGLIIAGGLIGFNQLQVGAVSDALDSLVGTATPGKLFLSGEKIDLSGVDIEPISSTAMAVATLFPELNQVQTEEDAINIMIPTGTPEYSEALGSITFDDPVASMEYLAKWYYSLAPKIQQNNPKVWQRYLNLAAAPRGISCEFCCGVGPQGITADGTLRCGCKHNPAVQALAIGLMQNTDYTDAQILREVMKWKTIFFPRNMVALAMQVAGTDPSSLKELPGMVGGC